MYGNHRFRFPRPSAAAADGRRTVGSDRRPPTPRALADHRICPFPAPEAVLGLTSVAGERDVIQGLCVPPE
ncbi:hypothetical protein TUSST3_89260 [Streptomyces sp. TUS-ST3]|nr:hypothetical protein TUSST3_89260 [Streptomyces sp. TUS-ST3]